MQTHKHTHTHTAVHTHCKLTHSHIVHTVNIPSTVPTCPSVCLFNLFLPSSASASFVPHFHSISFFFIFFLSPAVQSENSPLLLISSGVVLFFFRGLGPLILQLAPVGGFQPQPLFFSTLYSNPRSCVAPQNIICV